jgi:hypothetical protein
MMRFVAIVEVDNSSLNIVADIIGLKNCLALLRCVNEPSTDSVENSLGLKLTPESTVVDNNRWEKIRSVLGPVIDIGLNH